MRKWPSRLGCSALPGERWHLRHRDCGPARPHAKLRELADKADRCKCQLPSYITGEYKWVDDVEIDGKCYGLYRFELSAFGNFSAYTDNGGSVWLPAAFYDFDLKNAAQLKEVLEEVRSEWWQDWQSDDEFDQIIYKLFAAEC